MSYAMSYAMLYAWTYDMQVKTCNVVYDESIRCRTSDLRYRMHLRHRLLRCRTCYDIVCCGVVLAWRTISIYDVVRAPRTTWVRCRTCLTYDIVCNIGIIRCHRTSARIQRLRHRLELDIDLTRNLKIWYDFEKWGFRTSRYTIMKNEVFVYLEMYDYGGFRVIQRVRFPVELSSLTRRTRASHGEWYSSLRKCQVCPIMIGAF